MDMSDEDYENSFPDVNESHNELLVFQQYAVVYISLIFCFGLPGCFFMLRVLLAEEAWKKTSDFLLLQLTVSNLCCIATLPFLICNFRHGWIFGEWACGFTRGLTFLASNSYVLFLTSMTLHHYVTVIHPLRLPAHVTRKIRVIGTSSVIWLICACPSINAAVHSQVLNFHGHELCTSAIESVIRIFIITNVEIWLFYVTPFLIVAFCYIHMWIITKQGETNVNCFPSKSITRITVTSFLCLVPHNILSFFHSLISVGAFEYKYEWNYSILCLLYFQLSITYLCPILNPMLYVIGTERFRRHLRLPCTAFQERRGGGTSDTAVQFMTLNEDV